MKKIVGVEINSIAEELGIKPNSFLFKINNQEPVDRLDMIYFDSKTKIKLEVIDEDGVLNVYKFEKSEDEKLGLEIEGFDDIQTRWCANKCVFCFVDQLPKGMRKSLYVKDDDWRLSFVSGNYVTLTNLSNDDIKRICREKFSPLYVSVHATDEKVRNHLLGRTKSLNIMKLLKKFAKNGITIHTQAVLCPGINDGPILEKTLNDLFKLYPMVKSLAVVPVGLSGHRKNLSTLRPYKKEEAKQVLETALEFDKKCIEKTGEIFVFPSDEFYLQADMPFPPEKHYGDYDQIENGVGLVVKFKTEFIQALSESKRAKDGRFTLVTGVSATPLMTELANEFMNKHKNVRINVETIYNDYFGRTITVAGLITATDIIKQLKDKVVLEKVVLPKVMLRETENVFLDGMTLEELSLKLDRKVLIDSNAFELVKILEGEARIE